MTRRYENPSWNQGPADLSDFDHLTADDMEADQAREHLESGYHGIESRMAQEAMTANYCRTLAEFHEELHNPDFYRDTGEDPPTHPADVLWVVPF